MSENRPDGKKSPSKISLVCILAGAIIGAGVMKEVGRSDGPREGKGFDVSQMLLAGLGGGLGAAFGGGVGWLIERAIKRS